MTPEIERAIKALETDAYNLGKAEARGMIREDEDGPRANLEKKREAIRRLIAGRKPK